jgi:hypothetical protein
LQDIFVNTIERKAKKSKEKGGNVNERKKAEVSHYFHSLFYFGFRNTEGNTKLIGVVQLQEIAKAKEITI